jgi:hypothetical protein
MAKDLTARKEILTVKIDAVETGDDDQRPKNLRANLMPTDGYGLEVDGKMKSQHLTAEAAHKVGLELKTRFPLIQVRIFDAKAQTRTLVELPTR